MLRPLRPYWLLPTRLFCLSIGSAGIHPEGLVNKFSTFFFFFFIPLFLFFVLCVLDLENDLKFRHHIRFLWLDILLIALLVIFRLLSQPEVTERRWKLKWKRMFRNKVDVKILLLLFLIYLLIFKLSIVKTWQVWLRLMQGRSKASEVFIRATIVLTGDL